MPGGRLTAGIESRSPREQNAMQNIILLVHVLTALAIIGLILLQQGKGAVAGASFGGGASQTVFGSQGSSGFFTRATAILAVVFFATSFGLAIIAKQEVRVDDSFIPTDRKSTRLNSSHVATSYAVFCLKKKINTEI